jgi:succinoglycan biosynthesis protein ExoA
MMPSSAESRYVPERPFVTVVMPIRNEGGFIARSLRAVLAQDYPPHKLEVIVADGMSTDGTRDVVRTLQAGRSTVRLIDNPDRIVPCGLNLAIRQARGEIIVRVDGHTLISPDYVSQCVDGLLRTGAENVGGAMRAWGDRWFGEGVALATSSPFGVGGARFHYAVTEGEVDTVYMGAWRRPIFDRLGLFDEEMVRNQDDEFNYRILENGGRIVLIPGIRSVYTVRSSPQALWRQYFQYGFWKVRVMRKHPGQIRLRHAVPSLFVAALAGSFLAAWLVPRAGALCAGIAILYSLANLASAFVMARRGGWHRLPAVSLAYAILHVGYGIGLMAGLARFGARVRTAPRTVA